MLEVIGLVVKEVLGFAFGTKKKATYTMFIIMGVCLAGVTWYFTNKYGEMKANLVVAQTQIDSYELANKQLSDTINSLTKELNRRIAEYNDAVIKRRQLEGELLAVEKSAEEKQDVFEKECGRFDRLMQKKATLVIRYANRANQRLFNEFTEATRNH